MRRHSACTRDAGTAHTPGGRYALSHTVMRALIVLVLVGALEGLCRTGRISPHVLLAPTVIAAHGVELLRSGKFTRDIASTLMHVASAALAATLFGYAAGLGLHALPRLRRAIEPLLASYYAVPTFVFYPMLIVLFGVGALPIIAIAVLLAIVSMIVATLSGLDRVPRVWLLTARAMRLTPWRTVLHVKLPATLPHTFGGLRLVVAYSFIGVSASEFILSGSGIGYAIGYAYNNFQNDDMDALMLFVLLVVTLANATLGWVDRRILPWHRT